MACVVRRQNTHPYAAHIATVLTKKHNMSSFLEDLRQKFSRTRFPVHSRVAPVQSGRITRPCTTAVTWVLHRVTWPYNTARVLRQCVSAFSSVCAQFLSCTFNFAEYHTHANSYHSRNYMHALPSLPVKLVGSVTPLLPAGPVKPVLPVGS